MLRRAWLGGLFAGLLAGLFGLAGAAALAGPQQRLLVAPHATDVRLPADNPPHLVLYDADAAGTPPLLVWLAGTNGFPAQGPAAFYATALRQGYRVVGVSYLSSPAVGQVCTPARVRQRPACAELFRQQRVWGDVQSGLIDDRPEDAIVPRLTRLLQYLSREDAAGHWADYLDAQGQPRWDRLVLAGQSQGGGMAEFLAQTREVAGVLSFSGGWDHGPNGDIARWYRRDSATPPERWQATYHVDEVAASTLAQTYRALKLPPANVHALNLPVTGPMAHTEGVHNRAYEPLWRQMLEQALPAQH